MMRIAYGDLIGGLSGDMFVAALVDLGLPLEVLSSELRKISTLKFELEVAKKTVHSIAATQFQVVCAKNEAPRSWEQIRQLIDSSELAPEVKETGIKIFSRLAEVEGKIHGVPTEKVHFHEVGATDSIVDIIAASIGYHELKIGALHFSKVPLGRGRHPQRPWSLAGPRTCDSGTPERHSGSMDSARRGNRNSHRSGDYFQFREPASANNLTWWWKRSVMALDKRNGRIGRIYFA